MSGGAARAASFTEFQVNTYTNTAYQRRPAICAGAENFVVAWSDDREGYQEVFGQRIDRFGTPLGSEFRVNSLDEISISDSFQGPKVACDAAGAFVVVWVDAYHLGVKNLRSSRAVSTTWRTLSARTSS